jgi:hypothetical protein
VGFSRVERRRPLTNHGSDSRVFISAPLGAGSMPLRPVSLRSPCVTLSVKRRRVTRTAHGCAALGDSSTGWSTAAAIRGEVALRLRRHRGPHCRYEPSLLVLDSEVGVRRRSVRRLQQPAAGSRRPRPALGFRRRACSLPRRRAISPSFAAVDFWSMSSRPSGRGLRRSGLSCGEGWDGGRTGRRGR